MAGLLNPVPGHLPSCRFTCHPEFHTPDSKVDFQEQGWAALQLCILVLTAHVLNPAFALRTVNDQSAARNFPPVVFTSSRSKNNPRASASCSPIGSAASGRLPAAAFHTHTESGEAALKYVCSGPTNKARHEALQSPQFAAYRRLSLKWL